MPGVALLEGRQDLQASSALSREDCGGVAEGGVSSQLYGLFKRTTDGKHWEQVSSLVFYKEKAIRVFQDHLIYGYELYGAETRLIPIPKKKDA